MSENIPSPAARRPDRRVARTRDRLGDALLALLLAKPFDDITVREVLARAGVSRSTFYAHFRDKNDLFLSDVDQFFAMMSTLLARRVAAVSELFAHVAGSRDLCAALAESGRLHDVRELGEAHFARGIGERLAHGWPAGASAAEERDTLAHALAGALFALLFWWMRRGMPAAPGEMDRRFHALIPREPHGHPAVRRV